VIDNELDEGGRTALLTRLAADGRLRQRYEELRQTGAPLAAFFDALLAQRIFEAVALTALRLVVSFLSCSPPPLVSARWEQPLAELTKASLYVLTSCAIISGWVVVSTSQLPVPTRFFDLFVISNIARPDPSLFTNTAFAHRVVAWGIAFLIACTPRARSSTFREQGRRAEAPAAALAAVSPPPKIGVFRASCKTIQELS
jgi:hypothetical protein